MKPEVEKMVKRYVIMVIPVVFVALLIVIRALGFMTFQRKGWMEVASRFEADSVTVKAQRGSILSDERRVLVSSTPEYQFVFKYREFTKGIDDQKHRDEVVRRDLGMISQGLHEIMPEESAEEFCQLIASGLDKGRRSVEATAKAKAEGKKAKPGQYYTNLYIKGSKRLTYNRYKQVKAFMDQCDEEYRLYVRIDGKRAERKRLGSLWVDSLDLVAQGLHRAMPQCSEQSFRDSITKALVEPGKRIELCRLPANHFQMEEIAQLPMLRLGKEVGFVTEQRKLPHGFSFDEVTVRKNAYGLATRTLGMWNEETGTPRNGLELVFDSLLSGMNGYSHSRKVMDTYAVFVDEAPQNGCDIITTLNVRIQDIADKALRDQMMEQNGDYGTAIVMETKTGDIKALVNLTRQGGQFVIGNNIALNQGIETGSIFKPASLLAALDDGLITLEDSVTTAPWSHSFYGHVMTDDSRKTDVKKIPDILKYSSNIGTMKVIDRCYVQPGNAEAFLKKLQSMGIADDHQIIPRVAKSKLSSFAQIKEWKGTALWMAIGYGISVTPMNMVAFYNAIANGGCMMRPRLVAAIERDGHTVEKFDTKVAVEHIAGEKAIRDMQRCLVGVVNEENGTGARARSEHFLVAGKTGTAKITEHGSYAGRWMNFCGFFPADDPEYTCGVFIFRKAGTEVKANAGGSMSAPVLHEIAERVMAYHKTTEVKDIVDSTAVFVPNVKRGNADASDKVLDGLGFRADSLRSEDVNVTDGLVPDVIGLGAKDALYAMESNGIKVRLRGTGKVYRQSIAGGTAKRKGMTVELYLK